MPLSRKSWIDFEYTDAAANPKVRGLLSLLAKSLTAASE